MKKILTLIFSLVLVVGLGFPAVAKAGSVPEKAPGVKQAEERVSKLPGVKEAGKLPGVKRVANLVGLGGVFGEKKVTNHMLYQKTLKLEAKAVKLEASGDAAGAQALREKATAIQPIKTGIVKYQGLTRSIDKAQVKLGGITDPDSAAATKLQAKIQTLTDKRTTVATKGLESADKLYDKRIANADKITAKITATTPAKKTENLTKRANSVVGEANWIKNKTNSAFGIH